MSWHAAIPSVADALARLGIYWWLAALGLFLFIIERRRAIREELLIAGVLWLALKVLGWALVLLVPCIGANADAVLGFVVATAVSYGLPLPRWQRAALLVAVAAAATLQAASIHCVLPWHLVIVAGLVGAAILAAHLLGSSRRTHRLYQRIVLYLDRRMARTARIRLTPPLRAALRARLCQRLGLDAVHFQPLDANGAHASTPLIATGRKRDGSERRYFIKLMSQRNWRASLVARSLRWLQHHGRTEREPILLSLRAEAEYEHYMMLVFAEIGVPAPRSAGLFRLRPGVYALVSEFLEGARSLRGSGVVPVEYVYAALRALKCMRQAGCAHCDIKASNMMILPGWRFALVDLATARSNAGKKRLAADLADMLVALALFHEPQRVVEAARDVVGQEALERVLPYLHRRFINTETQKMIPPTLPRELRALVRADARPLAGHDMP